MPLADPESIDRLARLHKRAASVLSEASSKTDRALDSAAFTAPVADVISENVYRRKLVLRRGADRLLDVSYTLSKHAEWIRDTIAELESLEARIRAWADANPVGSAMGITDASLITLWPDTASMEWYDLADRLRARGAVF